MPKIKFVRQDNIKDCGAACLLMIIKYYGGNYPLEQLRDMLNTNKSGTTALDIINTSRKIGFDARGYKVDTYEDIKYPSIAHVIRDKTYHHFVVVQRVDVKTKTIYIADPAIGLKKYSFSDFDLIWTRIIITFYPIREISRINTFTKIKKIISQLITPYKKEFTIIFFISIMYTILNILNTFYFKMIIDKTNVPARLSLLVSLLFTFLTLTKITIDFIRNKLLFKIEKNIEKSLMSNTLKHLLELPYQYFNTRTTGDIISRLKDLDYVKELVSKGTVIFLIDLVLVIGSMIVMWHINYIMLLMTILIVIIYFLVVYRFNSSIKYFIMRNQEESSNVYSSLIENIKGINTIKNLNIEADIYKKTMTKYNSLIDNNCAFNNKYNNSQLLKNIVVDLGILSIIFSGGLFISDGVLTVSNFVIFYFFLGFFFEPLKNIFEFEPMIRSSINALGRTSEFFSIEKERDGNLHKELKGNIKIDKLSFAYNGIDETVRNIDMLIGAGSKVMLTGPSGVGKSTLFKMLMRYIDSKEGHIKLDENDLLDYSFDTLRRDICYVSQDETFFTDSLYNNIVLNRNISKEELKIVLDITCIDEIIKKHNRDHYMLLEEDASNLSGGEKERIMIARALLKNSKIYIFDESMSEMDVSLERKILTNIFKNYSDKTIIVISHRLDNKDLYDRVIKINDLKEGEI